MFFNGDRLQALLATDSDFDKLTKGNNLQNPAQNPDLDNPSIVSTLVNSSIAVNSASTKSALSMPCQKSSTMQKTRIVLLLPVRLSQVSAYSVIVLLVRLESIFDGWRIKVMGLLEEKLIRLNFQFSHAQFWLLVGKESSPYETPLLELRGVLGEHPAQTR